MVYLTMDCIMRYFITIFSREVITFTLAELFQESITNICHTQLWQIQFRFSTYGNRVLVVIRSNIPERSLMHVHRT